MGYIDDNFVRAKMDNTCSSLTDWDCKECCSTCHDENPPHNDMMYYVDVKFDGWHVCCKALREIRKRNSEQRKL